MDDGLQANFDDGLAPHEIQENLDAILGGHDAQDDRVQPVEDTARQFDSLADPGFEGHPHDFLSAEEAPEILDGFIRNQRVMAAKMDDP